MKHLIYQFIKQHSLAIIATTNKTNGPEAALVGIAVSADLWIIFDTVKTSRKYHNILQNPKVALVIGWDNETTVQYEGEAKVLGNNADAEKLKEIYFEVYPDGRERAKTWPGLVHIKVTPKWLRYSNFNEPVVIEEVRF
ncbi:MAG: Pyridoxamine 5-phosphate oxidase [Mucilaginibacter sp.]|nr:Pyridoxamine 5-phosphate oxidase [Mucilaginibacter sp.]